jgi:hypothetical protein
MINSTETYYSKTIQVGNVTVTIHRPILTDAERLKAEENVKSALSRFGRAMIGEQQ